jgi:3-oxoacyl-[acyl-carrier protein] reductase
MDLGIAGKVALITGGSRGIGRAISKELASEGCAVAIVARNQASIAEAVDEVRAAGGRAVGISADLSALENIDRVVTETSARLGPPDIGIFNPITPKHGAFLTLTEEDFAYAFHTLVLCFMRFVRSTTPHMREKRWGRIVTIGAACAKQPMRGQLNFAYALANTTRLAAVSLCKTASNELAPFGITVNTIATGAIDTGMAREFFGQRAQDAGLSTEQFMQALMGQVPVGRIGTPEEMAGLCAYLCSERAAYTTGETILCDGGLINSTL